MLLPQSRSWAYCAGEATSSTSFLLSGYQDEAAEANIMLLLKPPPGGIESGAGK